MTKENFVEIVIVLDRSGSMATVQADTIGGFNTFIKNQKAQALGEMKVTLAQFDDRYDIVYSGMDIKDVPLLTSQTYVPRGMTALYDAIGKTINEVGERLSHTPEKERPSLVVFVTLTDGHENSSQEFKQAQVKDMIKHQTDKYNWQFVFLGADQDAFQAESLGYTASNTFNYASNLTTDTFAQFSGAITQSRCCTATASSIGDTMRSSTASSVIIKVDEDKEDTK
jgi:hypothetical protein